MRKRSIIGSLAESIAKIPRPSFRGRHDREIPDCSTVHGDVSLSFNMMKTLLRSVLVIICLLLTRCLPEPLEVKGVPTVKPQMVVTSQYIPNEGLLILLTRSFGALDADDDSDPEALLAQIAVIDAVVMVSTELQTDTLINLENGFYAGSNLSWQAGQAVHLVVSSASMGNATAQTQVQSFIDFDSLEAELSFNGFDDTLVQVTYTALDPPGVDQYVITVQRIRQEQLLRDLLDSNAFIKLQDDAAFDGEPFGETFRAFPRNYQPGDTVAITLSRVSADYFEYLQLRQDTRFGWAQFLGEPVNYSSNIQGGLGYFNLNQPAVRFVVLE
jgi:hypothetical protein